jgi:hypothetical protein
LCATAFTPKQPLHSYGSQGLKKNSWFVGSPCCQFPFHILNHLTDFQMCILESRNGVINFEMFLDTYTGGKTGTRQVIHIVVVFKQICVM